MQVKIVAAGRRLLPGAAVLALAVALAGGCGPKPVSNQPAKKEFEAAPVRVWCGDARLVREFTPRVKGWANRTAAAVTFAPTEADADVLLVPPARLGRLDPAAGLHRVPPAVIADTSAYQWGGLIGVYQSRLANWGSEQYALPLVGEAFVLLYRADVLTEPGFVAAFRERYGRPPLPIRTWDDLAEVGQFATDRVGKPALPPLPSDPAAAVAVFGHIAASHDRASSSGRDLPPADPEQPGEAVHPYVRGLTFLTDLEALRDPRSTGWEVRVGTPAFGEAFRWFEKTAKLRPPAAGDPTGAVTTGSAVAAVVPLGELARLPNDPGTGGVDARFGVAGVPGSGGYYDATGRLRKTAGVNFVPYYPGGGLVGVVRSSAERPDACWALLTELGGPAGSAASLDDPGVGGGPLRTDHTAENPRLWQQYGFDPPRTADLNRAIREYVSPGTINPAVGLRTPDLEAVNALLARQVVRVAAGEVTADAGQKQAVKEWEELDARTPRDERAKWRRKSAGLD
jgi:ABC-type glycerol-3-phosphate transport system substrate-binding protein